MKKSKTIWCDNAFFPIYFGFAPDEFALCNTLKKMKIKEKVEYPCSGARCSLFDGSDGNRCAIVTVSEKCDILSPQAVYALLAHEAVHVWQEIREAMNEDRPSSEFEAYAIQHVVVELANAYERTRKPYWLKSKGGKSR